MSLIVRIGGAESNSFVTISEADTIIGTGIPDVEDSWSDLEDEGKEYRLVLAARMMSHLPLRGIRVYCNQNLCFPRSPQANLKIIPTEVKEAQCFLAYSVIHRGLAARPETTDEAEAGARVSSVSLGGLLSVQFSGKPVEIGSSVEKLIRSSQFPAYIGMTKYLSQFRGGTVKNASELTTCLTTTTTT